MCITKNKIGLASQMGFVKSLQLLFSLGKYLR